MYDFSTITEQMEKDAIAKFKEHGKGIQMGSKFMLGDDSTSSKWSDLIDTTLFSEKALKDKMINLAQTINNVCNDPLLGDMSLAFSFRDERNKVVKFTYLEMYCFLRGAFKYRKETVEYKEKVKKLAAAKLFVESNKTVDDKLKEYQELIKSLEGQVEIES